MSDMYTCGLDDGIDLSLGTRQDLTHDDGTCLSGGRADCSFRGQSMCAWADGDASHGKRDVAWGAGGQSVPVVKTRALLPSSL